jgi:hypothetical protein
VLTGAAKVNILHPALRIAKPLEHCIGVGRGGAFLTLTAEQDANLKDQ